MKDQVAIVTGASRGIGQAIAEELARRGCRVACVASKAANAQSTVELIQSQGGQAQAYGADVSQVSQIEEAFAAIEANLGTPSILINNAGITRDGLLMRMKDDDWDAVITTNLKSAYLTTKAVLKPMMKARYGRIVNVSSVIGLHGGAGQANYAASKAGLIGLTMSIAKELGSRGITCNAIAPGFIQTDMTEDLTEEFKQYVQKTAPAGRLGTPADIAPLVGFLASPEAAYITGQTITIDGGLML